MCPIDLKMHLESTLSLKRRKRKHRLDTGLEILAIGDDLW